MLASKKSKIFKTVHSSSLRTSTVGDKTLLKFYSNNPCKRQGDKLSLDNDSYIKKTAGNTMICCDIDQIKGVVSNATYPTTSNNPIIVSWTPVTDALYYTVSATTNGGYPRTIEHTPLATTATIDYENEGNGLVNTVTITAHMPCYGTLRSTIEVQPCFLAGSIVHMADGSTKAIEDVQVHDKVVGAFGEINEVLFLHRPHLGTSKMCCINGEHHTTHHHPHVSVDKKFYSGDPERVSSSTYGHTHQVLDEHGQVVEKMLYGLKKERIQKLCTGVELKTMDGSKMVHTIEVYIMPEDTPLYNLVVSGSHTYHVDGYAVTGWPREDDFNYDDWC